MAPMEMYSVRNGPVIDINVGAECKNWIIEQSDGAVWIISLIP